MCPYCLLPLLVVLRKDSRGRGSARLLVPPIPHYSLPTPAMYPYLGRSSAAVQGNWFHVLLRPVISLRALATPPPPRPLLWHCFSQVERALRVLDGAVAVFDAVSGVEPQSETVWRQADKYKVPRICFVNKMDRLGANFFRTRDMVISNLGAKPLVLQVPIGAEEAFQGVIDIVKMKAIVWTGEELGAKFEERDIPADLVDTANEYREKLIDTVVELDDAVSSSAALS